MIVAGFGCRAGCPAEELIAVLHDAEAACASHAEALAAPGFKRHEPGLAEAAARLGLDLRWIDEAALHAVAALCPTHSEAALRTTGHASIAEAAALAGAGPGARLIQPRIARPGATCAIASTP
jgi:cobalt-precorrin 5A hydrolase